MGATTGLALVTTAFKIFQVFEPNEPIPSTDSNDALGFLNRFVGSLAQQRLSIPAIAREVYPLVAGKGSPSNPYTIGPGGDLNTARPPNQSDVTGVALLLNASTPPVEVPYPILTDYDWRLIQIKDLANTQFTGVYYNPLFGNGLGAILL